MPVLIPDPVTEYARAVIDGSETAGDPVRMACQRHLDDLEKADFFYSRRMAARAFEFFEGYLVLQKGKFEGVPFKLLPWQKFVIGSLIGWLKSPPTKSTPRGIRRFKRAYIETGKGSGKSPLMAGLGIYCTFADGESRSEAYFIARTKEQARVPFDIAVNMVQSNDELDEITETYGGAHPYRIVSKEKAAFITRIASSKQGKGHSGPNAHYVLGDEYHEHESSDMLDLYDASTKQRDQAIVSIITNAGVSKTSPCGQENERAMRILKKSVEDNTTFAYICALADDDEPFDDESCWIKTNPSLPVIPGYDYIRKQIEAARGLASKEAVVSRLIFCRWTDAEAPWLSPEVWARCQADELSPLAKRKNWRKAMGVDLSLKTDFTAIAEVWQAPDGRFEAMVAIITPDETVKYKSEQDAAPYVDWVNEGHIETLPGSVIEYRDIAERLYDPYWQGDCIGIAYDGWNIEFLLQGMDMVGIPYYLAGRDEPKGEAMKMVRHGQSFASGSYAREQGHEYLSMPHSINVMEEHLLKKRIKVKCNPCLTMMAMNAVVKSDAVENRRFDKKAANRRIDGLVALTMAVGLLDMQPITKPTSPWDSSEFKYQPFK